MNITQTAFLPSGQTPQPEPVGPLSWNPSGTDEGEDIQTVRVRASLLELWWPWWMVEASGFSRAFTNTTLHKINRGGSSTAESAENWRDLPVWGSFVVARFSDLSKTSGPMLMLLEKNCQETKIFGFFYQRFCKANNKTVWKKRSQQGIEKGSW